MATREICDRIYSVGTIDWDLRYFDAIMPTPRGSSYNAYLVKGSKKTALIDTCKPNDEADFITNLMHLEQHVLDYIVVDHAEQDHSGLLPLLLEVYPCAKIVTNEICKDLLLAMHHLEEAEERFITIGDKETLSLGDKTLKFHLTPWVHWPDTMFTEVVEDRILFTTDFLGTHYAAPALYQDDENPDYLEAAKRYYAAIMMPFQSSVQKHLELIDEIGPKIIGPSHGPLLKMPAKIFDLYRDWSDDNPKNLVIVAYVSMHGSTELMTKFLVDELVQREVPVQQYNLLETDTGVLGSAIVDAATIIVATPTILFGPHPVAVNAAYLIRALRPKVKHLGVIGSYGWGTNAVNYLGEVLAPLGAEMLDSVYIKGHPDDEAIKALHAMADAIEQRHKML
ncbi:MAG: FprA family A-type flavoprotein [Methanocalculaceae archaeon]|jgi:flavorubredoxin|nr:FprA family A-type flavoprotein [Methanocalculaceae archaeon]